MYRFELQKHFVEKASFDLKVKGNGEEKLDVALSGGVKVPKDLNKSQEILINLELTLGSQDTSISMKLNTVTSFVVIGDIEEISEEMIQKQCLPEALRKMHDTVENTLSAYGVSDIKLPSFVD